MKTQERALSPWLWRSFAVYREGHVYDDTAAQVDGHPFAGKPAWTGQRLYDQLIGSGVEPSAEGVSVYVRQYDDGKVKALAGTTERWRLLRGEALDVWQQWFTTARPDGGER